MKNIFYIIVLSLLFSQPENNDWELPLAIRDLGWYPTNYECIDDDGISCNASNQWSCGNIDCNWYNTECGGTYGGFYDESNPGPGICHGLSDTINIGLSDSASIGFRYGEDEINLSPLSSMAPYIDSYFYHPEWWGTTDVNNVTCDWLQFDSDLRTYPDSINIMEWEIHTQIADVPDFVYYQISWPGLDLPEQYDIFLYLYDEEHEGYDDIYNMRNMNFIQVHKSYIVPTFNDGFHSRTVIRIGQCLESGPGEYYADNDGDGLGSDEIHFYCEEYLPEGYVSNNFDIDDEIYCESNEIDDCDICDGSGSSTYFNDNDGDGFGSGSELILCPSENIADLVTNNDDINDEFYCIENYIDNCNICDGYNNDIGCGCFEVAPQSYYYDGDNDGLGVGTPIFYCPELNEELQYDIEHYLEVPDNFVLNDNDINDNFYCQSNDIDDCNECDGFNNSCDIYGEGIDELVAIFLDSANEIRLYWSYVGGNAEALKGILILEQIDELWITIDSTSNIFSGEYNRTGTISDVGRVLGTLPYDRYYQCYKEQFSINDPCLERLAFDTIEEQSTIDIIIPLNSGNNMIGFEGIPDDNSIDNIFAQEQNDFHFIIGQGIGSFHIDSNNDGILDQWNGNLTYIEPNEGYWVNITEDLYIDLIIEDAIPTPENYVYEVEWGNNLISYIGDNNVVTLDAIPDYIKEVTTFIIGQGVGLFHLDDDNNGTFDSWSGNLNRLEKGKGYWINLNFMPDDSLYHFSWGDDNIQKSNIVEKDFIYENPSINIPEFEYTQSTNQSFYIIKKLEFNHSISQNGILLAYHNNQIIGARNWNGKYTDIPAMGKDNSPETLLYIEADEIPIIKYYDIESGLIHELISSNPIQGWINNGFSVIDELYFANDIKNQIANNFIFQSAFPNPFNPHTNLKFTLNKQSNTVLKIYDINGKVIDLLEDRLLNPGEYLYTWDAHQFPSGIYFAELSTNESNIVQKLIYLK
jgi:hypothetical protein